MSIAPIYAYNADFERNYRNDNVYNIQLPNFDFYFR